MADETQVAEHRRRWDHSMHALLDDWHLRATTAQFGHQEQAARTRWWYIVVGIPVVVLTTLVGTGSFATVNDATSHDVKILVGAISILAAVLAGIQTFLGFGQLSERHRIAATRYANVRRAMELTLAEHDASAVERIRSEMDKIGGASPQIGDKIWRASEKTAKRAIEQWHRGEADLDDEHHGKHVAKAGTSSAP